MKKPVVLYPLLFLHLFLALTASIGGALLMINPDGSLIQMQPGWLEGSPFSNYFIPGLLLFTFLGLMSLLTFFGLLMKYDFAAINRLNINKDYHWSWTFSLYAGISSITWITVQLSITRYFWIQPVIIFNGLLILVFTLFPGTMNYFSLVKK